MYYQIAESGNIVVSTVTRYARLIFLRPLTSSPVDACSPTPRVCRVALVGGIQACARLCKSIKGCNFFSTSTSTDCYACFIYKSCDNPITSEHDYKIYRIKDRGIKTNIEYLNHKTFIILSQT